MKLATFNYANKRWVGQVDIYQGCVYPFALAEEQLTNGVQVILDLMASNQPLPASLAAIGLEQIELLSPLPRPRRNIFCAGKNYLDHVKEVAASLHGSGPTSSSDAPSYPIIFTKVPESVIGPGMAIKSHANLSQQVDYEAELAVVIGKSGCGISREDAMNYVWGYTIINDISARDLQTRHQQWHLAKSLDGFCPMGPWLVSRDEINAQDLAIKCWVNDELRQNARTNQFIFDIPSLIATISAGITLYPGDIIATGTPSGVGMGMQPPRFLRGGDQVVIEIEGIGQLANPVA